jgi:hypothetical protein
MKNLLLLAALLSAGMVLYAQNSQAVVQEVRGTVELKAPGSSVWEAAVPGRELTRDTQVSTGFKSSALIKLGNSVLTVQPLTRLSLGEIQTAAETERVNVQLRVGRIRANVTPPAGQTTDFVIRSPSATASVRGTVFTFDTLNLTVNEGTVHFSGADNTAVYVQAGQSSAPDPVTGKAAAPIEVITAQTPVIAGTEIEDIVIPAAVIPSPVAVPAEPGVVDEGETTGRVGIGTYWWD